MYTPNRAGGAYFRAQLLSKYARMVGVTLEQLDQMREHSKQTFYRYFPEFEGPFSFAELYDKPGLYKQLEPTIPKSLY